MELGGAGRPNAVGFGGGAVGVGQRRVGERTDRWGPCISEGREREGTEDGRHESKKKTYSAKYAKGTCWPGLISTGKNQRVLIFEFK
jgi:hypothetical protein